MGEDNRLIQRPAENVGPDSTVATNQPLLPGLCRLDAVIAVSAGFGERVAKVRSQFRHLAAKISLDEEPNNFEGVRQLLNHKHTKSTMSFYAGMQTPNATRHFDRLLEQRRQELAQQFDERSLRK